MLCASKTVSPPKKRLGDRGLLKGLFLPSFICQSSLQARRDRFARYETATSCLYEEKRRRGRIKGGGELFCFATLATASRA